MRTRCHRAGAQGPQSLDAQLRSLWLVAALKKLKIKEFKN
jgi:hypothetical protein